METIAGPEKHRYLVNSVACKNLFYGTAWKKKDTADLVYSAIKAGFRSIATAAQPKHYREDLVGEGVRRAIQEKIVSRKDLYIQTTFTPFHSQDPHDCPYDPQLGIAQQVDASLQISRQNFTDALNNGPGYLDAVLLHDVYPSADENAIVWRSLSAHVGHDSVRTLGLSNVDNVNLEQICTLHEQDPKKYARPVVVQNRFHQGNDYDVEVRALCKAQGITYQAFGVRANSNMLDHPSSIVSVATNANVSREAALYAMLMNALGSVSHDKVSLDMQVVVGTSKTARMAVLEEVGHALTVLDDAHWSSFARSQQQQQQRQGDSRVEQEGCGQSTIGGRECDAFRLARRAFLIALGVEV